MAVIDRETVRDGLRMGSVAAVISGRARPVHALLERRAPLEASLAAGALLFPRQRRPTRPPPAGALVHLALSLGWALVLAAALPRKRTTEVAAIAGLGIAPLDLGMIRHRFGRPRCRCSGRWPTTCGRARLPASRLRLTASSGTGLSAYSRWSRWLATAR